MYPTIASIMNPKYGKVEEPTEPPVPTYEAETTAYMNAISIPDDSTTSIYGITNNEVWVAVDNYFKGIADFKQKMLAVYLFIGGTASAHKFNSLNPVDDSAAFRILWSGGTHSAGGFNGNASGYGDTRFIQDTHSTIDDESFGLYSRTDSQGTYADMGVWDPGVAASYILSNLSGEFYLRSQNETSELMAIANSLGYFSGSRIGTTVYNQKNDVIQSRTRASMGLANRPFYIGGRNHPSSMLFSPRQYSYAYIGKGLTEAEMLANKNAVQQLQTALNRNV